MESYVSQLQQQSFLTNLQALYCAASLGMRLQKANVSYNVYNLCHINLKDFSLPGAKSFLALQPSASATMDTSFFMLIKFSCSVTNVDEFECTVESSRLMMPARKIALNGMSNMDGFPVSPEHSTRIDDCKNIVCRLCVSTATAELPHQLASLKLCCITWHEVVNTPTT
ncbi:hypothetical protein FH972_014405 [Carpinus fangiana]|uniref:At1g61900-like C-terminal domain-containing protein n=1 Tax=Carpinus fangiana TaxID=176857 RepID=A0A5N6R9W1_9ROSI|nr:hypothetical protein FH972_014405 [Carpinus fangiana]